MRKLLSKRFETVASIALVAGFAAVSMFFNGSRLAYFRRHPINHLTDTKIIPAPSPVYARNIWKGKSTWTPVAFNADGSLTLGEFMRQMYGKRFGSEAEVGAVREPPVMREGSSGLPHWVHVVARHADGTVFLDEWGHNLRTNAGANWQYNQMAGTTAAACTYLALTNAAITPNATDTSLASEITSNGLARVNAAPTHTANASSYTLGYTFTASGTQAAQAAGVLNASSSGTLCFENTFTQASLVANDTLTVTWTINF